MKVLIVSNFYYPNVVGGAEKVAQNLAEGLVARDHKVVVVTLNPDQGSKTGTLNGVRVHSLALKNLYPLWRHNGAVLLKGLWHVIDTYNPFMAASFRTILESERPDVVNTRNIAGFSSSIWRSVIDCQLPLVHTAHDYYLLCPPSTMLRNGQNCDNSCIDCSIFSWMRKKTSKLVDVATADSRFTLERHIQFGYFSSAEHMPIYNCCEIPREDSVQEDGQDRPVRFGFLGRLDPAKGVHLLIRSFLDLPQRNAELLVAGRGNPDYERELKVMAGGRPEVRWLGYVSPEILLQQVDMLIVPSLWNDSAPVVVLESMAHGVPLIGSCRGGIPELMGEGTGWTFDPTETNALTGLLQKAIKSPEKLPAMGERARERARFFSTENMVSNYLEAFSHAIARNERRHSNARLTTTKG